MEMSKLHQEISLLRSLEHPNIVRYLGSKDAPAPPDEHGHVDRSARMLYIFTEWVPGGSLKVRSAVGRSPRSRLLPLHTPSRWAPVPGARSR